MEQKTNNCPFEGLTPEEVDALKRVAVREMSKNRVSLLRNRAREIAKNISKEAREIEFCSQYLERPSTKGFMDGKHAATEVHALAIELHDIMEELVTIDESQKGGLR